MASDSVAERRAEFKAGLATVDPQIKGLQNKINDDISPDLKAALGERLAFLQDRQAKIRAASAALDAADAAQEVLEDDGFPDVPNMEVPESLFLELKEEGAADDAAAGGFEVTALAANLGISLGSAADKPVT